MRTDQTSTRRADFLVNGTQDSEEDLYSLENADEENDEEDGVCVVCNTGRDLRTSSSATAATSRAGAATRNTCIGRSVYRSRILQHTRALTGPVNQTGSVPNVV